MDTKWKSIISKIFIVITGVVFAACISLYQGIEEKVDLLDAIGEESYIQSNVHEREVTDAFNQVLDAVFQSDYIMENDTIRKQEVKNILGLPDYFFYYSTSDLDSFKVWNTYMGGSPKYNCYYKWVDGTLTKGRDTNNKFNFNRVLSYNSVEQMDNGEHITIAFSPTILHQKEEAWNAFCLAVRIILAILVVTGMLLFILFMRRITIAYYSGSARFQKVSPDFLWLAAMVLLVLLYLFQPSHVSSLSLLSGDMDSFYLLMRNSLVFAFFISLFLLLLFAAVYDTIIELRNKSFYKHSLLRKMITYLKTHKNSILSKISNGLSVITATLTGKNKYTDGILATEKSRLGHLLIGYLSLIVMYVLLIFFFTENEFFLALIPQIIAVILTIVYIRGSFKIAKHYRYLEERIQQIHSGNYQEPLLLPKATPFADDLKLLSEIGSGFANTLEKKIKAEQMKSQLVTNVSHDLKTPLTSIISYIDLLDREPDLSEEARGYVSVLIEKSDRLKDIVSDVFELAKTTSGEIKVEQKQLDLKKLLIQTITDMDDRIQDSGMQLKTSLPADPVPIVSDGNRIYRVLQNLLDNAFKYSLPATRIYLNLTADEQNAHLTIKNTASYEMTFTKEEVLERFYCGDSSRNQAGSGLGLSIAQGFTIACGGTFDICLDGDQFNVLLSFPLFSQE